MSKTIALFGGSFNPPHEGHFGMAQYICQNLKVDEFWFLFGINRFKDISVYAPFEDRLAMGQLMARHYADLPLVMSGIERELKTHLTCEVLPALSARFPEHRFIWVMGADNLARIHTWDDYETIVENYPMAIFDRPGFRQDAEKSVVARTYPHLIRANPEELLAAGNGWQLLDNPTIDLSSTQLMRRLRAGETRFEGPFQDVADYILTHGLYNCGAAKNDSNIEPSPVPA